MAYLVSPETKYQLYLKAFHQFGRLSSAVDTLIASPEISRIHAIIEWIDNAWFIRDISKNGVWLNNEKITANKLYRLNITDEISFAEQKKVSFIVESLEQPKDILIPHTDPEHPMGKIDMPIILEQYHLLPSEKSPELVVFYNISDKSWYCENINDEAPSKISDGELLKFSNTMWQLIKGADCSEKETIALNEQTEQNLTFVFNISQDEELTELTLKNNNDTIECDTRSHHYLTALLARYRTQDNQKLIPQEQQGWRTIEQLTKDIGLSENHINIQIHRARKQLADKLQSLSLFGPLLIERKRGKVRFAATDYKIFKGHSLEVDSMELQSA